ncbi:MAG: ATP-binding cassette domain-containing protein, partial [Christensenellales bacterium]|nr:ATP-binding cassette domain-containing protein [Christensenellales bacterium]
MAANTLIHVRSLEKSFFTGSEIKALNGISVDIRRGEVVVAIGPSGSGKSTFLRCLNLLETPSRGTIMFEGVDITDPGVNINHYRQRLGMVFQHFNLFPNMTVLRNLTIAPMELKKKSRREAEDMAMGLLARVGLENRAGAYPDQLSGGQKQRIAIV